MYLFLNAKINKNDKFVKFNVYYFIVLKSIMYLTN